MKLQELWDRSAPTQPQVIELLKQQLPGIEIKPPKWKRRDRYSRRIIEINPRGDGFKLMAALLGKSEGQIYSELEKAVDDSVGEVDENDYDNEEWEFAWMEAMEDVGERSLQRFVKLIPKGWRLQSHLFSLERDIMSPHFSIEIKTDIDRKSRSQQTEFYHLTLASNLPAIMKQGLTPKSSSKNLMMGTFRNKIFLMNPTGLKIENVKEIANMLQSDIGADTLGASFGKPKGGYKDMALLKVTVPVDQVKRLDRDAPKVKGLYTQQPIAPENIKVVYKGPTDNMRL